MADLRVPDLNKVLIAGRLTRDPDLRYTNSGKPFCRLGVANTRYFKKQDGERGEDTTFVDVVIWGNQAEWIGQRLRKGRPVIVEGNLRSYELEDKETGQKRTRLEINALRVNPLDWDEDRGGGSAGTAGGHGGRSSAAAEPAGAGAASHSPAGGGYAAPPRQAADPYDAPPRHYDEPAPEDDIPF